MAKVSLWSKKIQHICSKHFHAADIYKAPGGTYICLKHSHAADIYRATGGTRHSLIKGSCPKLHSWNTFGEGLGKNRKPLYKSTSPRKKICLDLDLSGNQKDISDFSVQRGQEQVSQSCTKMS